MNEQRQSSRQRIIQQANRLFYTKGYNQTSFADIATAVGITKGNLHYHFRSKDELLEVILDYRVELITEQLVQWDNEFPQAKDKLRRFVQMLRNEETDLVRYGCPIGSLNVELGKYQQDQQLKARAMFDLFQHWLEKAFRQLGKQNSRTLSQHLLAMAQGAALMAYVYADKNLLHSECENMQTWIDSL